MIRVIVKSADGGLVAQKDFLNRQLADEWIKNGESKFIFGVPERWIHEDDLEFSGEDKTRAIASKEVGGPDEDRKSYKFQADYSIETFEISLDSEAQALRYLSETDWYVIRKSETGLAVPEDVLALRAAARAKALK